MKEERNMIAVDPRSCSFEIDEIEYRRLVAAAERERILRDAIKENSLYVREVAKALYPEDYATDR